MLPQHLPDFGPQVHGADHVLAQGQGTRCCSQAWASTQGEFGKVLGPIMQSESGFRVFHGVLETLQGGLDHGVFMPVDL